MIDYSDKCVNCCGDVVEENVDVLLRGGGDVAVVSVAAGVCQRCGERYYDLDTARKLDEVQLKLKRRETTGLKPIGRSYEVA